MPRPVFVFSAVSTVGVPMASLSDGGRGFAAGASVQTAVRNFKVFSWSGFRLLDHLVGHAAPGLVGFEEFDHGRFGGRETLHQRADLLALGLALAGSANGPGPLFRIAAQLQEVVALRPSGLRRLQRRGAAARAPTANASTRRGSAS